MSNVEKCKCNECEHIERDFHEFPCRVCVVISNGVRDMFIHRGQPTIADGDTRRYSANIAALIERQRDKGLKKYGIGLEENVTLSSRQRIEHAEEELVDALMYLEHLKAAVGDRLTANDYQRMAMRTAVGMDYSKTGKGLLINGLMGLNGEAGECIDIMKKHLFQGHELDREHLIEELGDCAWYLAVSCEGLGVTLEEVMKRNTDKLKARYPDGFDKARSINRKGGDAE